jgi:aldehyde:ferredoxin oxidoreductase
MRNSTAVAFSSPLDFHGRLFEELSSGPRKGSKLDREKFDTALRLYYAMMGWDSDTGIPTAAKLLELGIGWVAQEIVTA